MDVALDIAGVEKVSSEKLQLQSTLGVNQFEFLIKDSLATVEICVLCGWRLLNHSDIVSETTYSCNKVGQVLAVSCSGLYPLVAAVP